MIYSMYIFACVDDKFSKPFKSQLNENVVYNLIKSLIEERKYCTDAIKEHVTKELVMNNGDDKDFENSTKYWVSDNVYVDGDAKVRDRCHITGKW